MHKTMLVFISLFITLHANQLPTISAGTLDLRSYNIEKERPLRIKGNASLYWKKHLSAQELQTSPIDAEITLPGTWNNLEVQGTPLSGQGYGTIAFKILLPKTKNPQVYSFKMGTMLSAYRLFIDSSLIMQVGTPGTTKATTKDAYKSVVCYTPPVKDSFTLILHISNFEDFKGGPWHQFYFGSMGAIHYLQNSFLAYDLFIIGFLIFFALIHLTYAIMYKKGEGFETAFYLAIFTIIIALRTALMGERFLYVLLPNVPHAIFLHLEYFTFFFGMVLYHAYIHFVFRKWSSTLYVKVLTAIASLCMLITLVTPLSIYSKLIPYYEVIILITLIYQGYIAYRAIKEAPLSSALLVVSTLIITSAALHDILQDVSSATLGLHLLPLGTIVVVVANGFLVVYNNRQVYLQNQKNAQNLINTNKTLRKFVPQEFFESLNVTPLSIQLGDHINAQMSVLFCDIRNFTPLSEQLTSHKTFQFINEYHAIIAPTIKEHGGFIDKFIGDAVIALFPNSPDDATQAALAMQERVATSSLQQTYHLNEPLCIGIGIHYGSMILGVIGNNERVDSTVIGDAVNTSSRVEQMTKIYRVPTIITRNVLINTRLETRDTMAFRHLGSVTMKGKKELLSLYELLSPTDQSEVTQLKITTKKEFEQGVALYENQKYLEALSIFKSVIEQNPHDGATQHFISSCMHRTS